MKKILSLAVMLMALIVPHCAKAFELPCVDLNGVYVSGTAACNFAYAPRKHGAKLSFDPGYFLGTAVGYRICDDFRAEAEFGYRNNHLKRVKFGYNNESLSFKIGGHAETFSGMANVYYDVPVCFYSIRPYVGAGIGYAYTKFDPHAGASSDVAFGKTHKDGFAWQVMAGVSYPICDHVDLAIEYRFFRNEAVSRLQNHDVGINARYSF